MRITLLFNAAPIDHCDSQKLHAVFLSMDAIGYYALTSKQCSREEIIHFSPHHIQCSLSLTDVRLSLRKQIARRFSAWLIVLGQSPDAPRASTGYARRSICRIYMNNGD